MKSNLVSFETGRRLSIMVGDSFILNGLVITVLRILHAIPSTQVLGTQNRHLPQMLCSELLI